MGSDDVSNDWCFVDEAMAGMGLICVLVLTAAYHTAAIPEMLVAGQLPL